jgi:hypothetical protein
MSSVSEENGHSTTAESPNAHSDDDANPLDSARQNLDRLIQSYPLTPSQLQPLSHDSRVSKRRIRDPDQTSDERNQIGDVFNSVSSALKDNINSPHKVNVDEALKLTNTAWRRTAHSTEERLDSSTIFQITENLRIKAEQLLSDAMEKIRSVMQKPNNGSDMSLLSEHVQSVDNTNAVINGEEQSENTEEKQILGRTRSVENIIERKSTYNQSRNNIT